MAKLIIRNVDAFNGEYDIDEEQVMNGHEAHFVKNIAGIRLGDLNDAMEKGDYDLFVAFAVISMWRNGKIKKDEIYQAADLILESPIDSVTFEAGDARPPDLTQPVESSDSSSDGSSVSSNGHGDDPQATILASTGSLG